VLAQGPWRALKSPASKDPFYPPAQFVCGLVDEKEEANDQPRRRDGRRHRPQSLGGSPSTFTLFLSSTCTYKKHMFKPDAILSLFARFKNFTSFQVIFSKTADMNCKCMKYGCQKFGRSWFRIEEAMLNIAFSC
jgi:hypothetical protein